MAFQNVSDTLTSSRMSDKTGHHHSLWNIETM